MSENPGQETYQILLTDKAARVIHEAFEAEQVDKAHAFVRVGAHPGGCSGYKFDMDFAEGSDVGDSDEIFEHRGIRIVVDRSCLTDILGSLEIDYQDGSMIEQGFAFRRLSSGAQCGCGESFTPLKDARQN
jgi:iron-sulfur cluster assembly accessory protein